MAFELMRVVAERWERSRGRAHLAALDPDRGLNAVALTRLGIDLSQLLVVVPPPEKTARCALRLVRSGLFAALWIDLTARSDLSSWRLPSRRLSLAAREIGTTVFLRTGERRHCLAPLWTAARVEVKVRNHGIEVVLQKHRSGKVGKTWWLPPRCAPWSMERSSRLMECQAGVSRTDALKL